MPGGTTGVGGSSTSGATEMPGGPSGEGGPPEDILTRFNDMFQDLDVATHLRAEEVMRDLGWN